MSKIEFIKTLESIVDMLNMTTTKSRPIKMQINKVKAIQDRLVVTINDNHNLFEIYDSDGDVTREEFVDLILKLGK